MADWYVYQHDGDPLGPWSTDTVANAILAGKLAPDVWVAAPGGPRWLRALDVPVIGRLVEGIPTVPRRDSGLRLMPGAFSSTDEGLPAFNATMMIVKDDELEAAPTPAVLRAEEPVTRRTGAEKPEDMVTRESPARQPIVPPANEDSFAYADADPPTEPAMPPSSTPSLPPGGVRVDAREAPSSPDRRRRRQG